MKIDECPECLMYLYDRRNVMLVEACASVGISRGKSTEEMLTSYLGWYHNHGHKEMWRDPDRPE